MPATQRLQKIAREGHMIGNGLRDLIRIDKVCRLTLGAIGHIDECQTGSLENGLELQRIFSILLDIIRVRLDALQSHGGDFFHRPHEVVLWAPDGTGASEKNVRIDGIERLVRNRAPRLGQPNQARRRQSG